MVKPKEVSEEGEEVKSEGLEITSIGCLYKGPWEKKYWSSSRGKDRYPYPVGYHAVRAYNGNTCKMEIHEGPKGPLFMITSADGHSCSGQTPDIAWEKFQKKHCSHMKTWHGKRLSCKIDGVEFFGFKNSFVQRLLRELVANINGTVERSLLFPSLRDEASSTKQDNQNPNPCEFPVLQPRLQKPPITKKRSRKCEIPNTKPVDGNELKRPRSADQVNHNRGSSVPSSSSKQRNDFHKVQGVPPSVHLNSKTIQDKNGNFSAQDGFSLESVHFSNNLAEESFLAQEVSEFAGLENSKSTTVANNLVEEENLSKNFSFQEATEDEAGDAPVLKDSSCAENANLCAPDTLDFVQDNSMHSSLNTYEISNFKLKEEFAANNVTSTGLVADSHAEEEIGTFNSNANSEKGDFDSVGQEITESMMTVLLPQAIPLLSRKKKATIRPSESLPCRVNLEEGKSEASCMMDALFPAAELIEKPNGEREVKLRTQDVDLGLGVQNLQLSKSVVLDSFEDNQCGDHMTNQVQLSSNIVEADEPSIDKDTNLPKPQKEVLVEHMRNESLVYHVETRNSQNVLSNEANMALEKTLPDTDACISESVTDCRSSGKEVFSEKFQDVIANLDKNSAGVEIYPLEKNLKVAPDCTEDANDADKVGISSTVQLSRKDIPVKVEATETGSFAQIPNKVYTRKKVSKRAPLTKKFDGPLSESIICRNIGDDYVPKHHQATEQCKENFVSEKVMLDGQSHGLPVISQNSTMFSDSKDKDFCNSFDPSTLHMKNSEVNSDKELVEQVNLVEFNSSVASQKQEISYFDYNAFNAKEDKFSSDLKLQKNVESNNELAGTFDLLGCYFHPMPILSVFLCTTGNEIYVCASCGFLVDKKRTLYVYKVSIQEPRVGHPSFVGNTSVMLPFLKDNFGREIALERSCFQFTPDGQHLVLLDSMKTPYCREGRIDCLCSTCTSQCFEENALKIVEVKPGYVSVLAKLKTVDCVRCMLICEPNHLIAVGESGHLHLWEMNSTWSAQIEECIVPISDCIYPCIVELKRIPCAPLVVGHNGFGEFGIWDISKRAFVSRFSTPSTSVNQFVPIDLLSWQQNGSVFMDTNMELTEGIMAATKSRSSKHSESNSFLPSEGEDFAIWLLVSTISDTAAQHNYISSDVQINSVRLWRLALLVKNVVIFGSPLDPRTAAIGASSGCGIIGTSDGLVYAWDLSSGNKLGTLHHFKGEAASCIATDDSRSQVLAVAGDGGQLLLYLHARENFANK